MHNRMSNSLQSIAWVFPHKQGVLELKENYAYIIHGPTEHNQEIICCYESLRLSLFKKQKSFRALFYTSNLCSLNRGVSFIS